MTHYALYLNKQTRTQDTCNRDYTQKEEGTATIVKTTGTNNPTKYCELTWKCETESEYSQVKNYYPNATVINL